MEQLKNFINGKYQPPSSGKYIDKVDPCTGSVIYQLPDSDEVDIALAVQAAKKAFEKWSSLPVSERSQILFRIADGIDTRLPDLAEAETVDVGKPLHLSKSLDIPRAAQNFRFFASRILHKQETATDMDGKAINYTLRQPLGVTGLISPWNLPLYLLTWKIAPCLAMGNTAVCKPSELTPKTAYLLGEIMQDAGLPPGVCNLVLGLGETVGATLCAHPGVKAISFTGGTDTGHKILAAANDSFKKVSLELGGKNPTIVFDDADLKKTVPAVLRASFLNQGEICLCGERLFVQEKIYDEFVDSFVSETKKLVVGNPMDEKTFMGPLISQAHFDKVSQWIERAKKDQGKILCGEENLELPEKMSKGFFMRPTVIADMSHCTDLHQQEAFGPIVNIIPFKYAHQVPKTANAVPYGLSASLFTQNLSRAHKMAAQLEVGTVWINNWLLRDLRMPFGGVKHSGQGREGGDYSFDFFSEEKTVCVQL